jgi:hypothetical protein
MSNITIVPEERDVDALINPCLNVYNNIISACIASRPGLEYIHAAFRPYYRLHGI